MNPCWFRSWPWRRNSSRPLQLLWNLRVSLATCRLGGPAGRHYLPPAARRMRVLCLMMLLAFIGLATQVWRRQDFRPRLSVADGETALFAGCITVPPVFSDTKATMTVHLSARSAARVTVLLKDQRRPRLRYGQRVEIAAEVRSPHNFGIRANLTTPAGSQTHTFSGRRQPASLDDVRVEPGSCGHPGLAAVFGTRDSALSRLDRLYRDDHRSACC